MKERVENVQGIMGRGVVFVARLDEDGDRIGVKEETEKFLKRG